MFVSLKKLTAIILPTIALAGCAGGPSIDDITAGAGSLIGGSSGAGGLGSDEIALGLKEALTKGSEAVVSQLGVENGFNGDSQIRIPLPKNLIKARDYASKVGLAGSFDDLETRLNRAAEKAAPKAKSLFLGAIKDMSVSDARGILTGPDDAATKYFEGKTGTSLADAMKPIVDESLAEVGAVQTFNKLLKSYRKIPLAPKADADLTSHVVEKGMQGIFFYLAQEEKAIRDNPLKRTTSLLKKVFAGQ